MFHGWLRLTYSSEKGAALAYRGHSKAVKSQQDAKDIAQIEADEWHHRETLLPIMERRGVRPWVCLEGLFWCIGSTIGGMCRIWGEWASAKGASVFEINGVNEYSRLAVLARRLGDEEVALQMEEMARQESDHQAYFKELARSQWRGERKEAPEDATEP